MLALQECWDEDPRKRPGFEHIIISVRGLLEGATNQHKLQKTLTGAPALLAPSDGVSPALSIYGQCAAVRSV